jgi:hypothetical protein
MASVADTAGEPLVESQYYTHAFIMKWNRPTSRPGTLFRHGAWHHGDACATVQHTTTYDFVIGMTSRHDGFRSSDPPFAVVSQQRRWELVVITGAAGAPGSSRGVTTYYMLDFATGQAVGLMEIVSQMP